LFLTLPFNSVAQDQDKVNKPVDKTHNTRIYGEFDSDVELPARNGVVGERDTTASAEINQYRRAVGSGSWTGMQGVGQITYGSDTTQFRATLSIVDGKSFLLEAQSPSGQLTIKIHGRVGTIQQGSSNAVAIPPSTAASGLVQFELPLLDSSSGQIASLIEHGSLVLDGHPLHRVAYQTISNSQASNGKSDAVVTDLYFDPSTHLLVKSANLIELSGGRGNRFLRVITYEDYRTVDGLMVPFRFTQTLNGQKQWTLQFSKVQLNPTLPPSSFQF
jgi:hypothetical protein